MMRTSTAGGIRWGHEPRPVRTFSEGFDPALLIDTEIRDQPDNDAPLSDGPKESPRRLPKGMIDAIDSEQFEHCLPDMNAVIEMKTWDIDGFLIGMRALSDQPHLGRQARAGRPRHGRHRQPDGRPHPSRMCPATRWAEVVASDPAPTGPRGECLGARPQAAELFVTPLGGARPGRVRLDRAPDG
jgi:hypothetical protein